MKKSLLWLVVVLLSVSMIATFSFAGCKKEEEAAVAPAEEEVAEEEAPAVEVEEPVTIIVTSWRTEDIDAMNAIDAIFMEEHPNIKVEFTPIKNTEYYAQLGTALQTGTGVPDVLIIHSYGPGLNIYKGGYLADLNDLMPELSNLPPTVTGPWTKDGKIYGVPSRAVTHGIYYNKGIFDKYGLTEPKLWSDFIKICDTLKENGETVISQGSKDGWTLYVMGYSGYGDNFYGGEASRQKVLAKEMKITDEPFIKAFEAMDSLTKYYPDGFQAIDYVGSTQLFVTGQAAIYIGGSWEIQPFKNAGMDFELGWFAPPVVNEGDKLQYTWNPDQGVAMYKDTPYQEEVLEYLKFCATPEFVQAVLTYQPGFFGNIPGDYEIDPLAAKMLDATKNADLTVTLTDEKLSDQEPAGSVLFYEACSKLANGEFTPEQAAKHIQDGLDTWYFK